VRAPTGCLYPLLSQDKFGVVSHKSTPRVVHTAWLPVSRVCSLLSHFVLIVAVHVDFEPLIDALSHHLCHALRAAMDRWYRSKEALLYKV